MKKYYKKQKEQQQKHQKVIINDEDNESQKQEYAVHLQNLRKTFDDPEGKFCSGEQKTAISNLSFCLEYGECFGLLGVNGAGKTTFK